MLWDYRTNSAVNVAITDYALMFRYRLMNLYVY